MSAFYLSTRSAYGRYVAVSAAIAVIPFGLHAETLSAGTVMQKMNSEERFAYVAGVVEGLAISRYMQDGKKLEGMNCIYDWFYKTPNTVDKIYAAFEHFPGFPPGSVVDALVRKTCA